VGDGSETFAAAMMRLAAADLQGARRLMKLAAELDHLPALSIYASFVEHGVGGEASMSKALNWYKRAATRGDHGSCVRMGEWYVAHAKDAQAKFWLTQAWGSSGALLRLIRLYIKSRSVRSTNLANDAFKSLWIRRKQMSDIERQEAEKLRKELSKRKGDAIFSKSNQRKLQEK
jgi:TPR repeat protein